LTARDETRRGGLIAPTALALTGVAILIALGVWQIERLSWKENLIATIDARITQAPQQLPPPADWPRLTAGSNEYRRVTFPAAFLAGQEAFVYSAGSALRPDIKGTGYWVFAPARLSSGGIVIVNRGFVPLDRKDPASRAPGMPKGSIDIVGIMRWPEEPGLFTPAADPKEKVWYLRDPQAMAQTEKWGAVAPFYIDQESPVPAGGLPLPGRAVVNLPNNHLQYAITWFGLAFGLAGVYAVWVSGRLRGRG
jgi:surfeit locus 1 family protein